MTSLVIASCGRLMQEDVQMVWRRGMQHIDDSFLCIKRMNQMRFIWACYRTAFLKIRLHLLDFLVLGWTKLVHQLWQLVNTSSVIIIKTVVQGVSDTPVGVVILPALTEMTWAFLICKVKITWYQVVFSWLFQVTGFHSQFLCRENWEKSLITYKLNPAQTEGLHHYLNAACMTCVTKIILPMA